MKRIINTVTLSFIFSFNTITFGIEATQLRYDHSNNIITISQQDLANNDAEFERKLLQGAKDGIFYIEMSEQCKSLIFYAFDFGNSFYKDDALKNQQFPSFSGYHDRENAQVESFYGEYSLWQEIFSTEINQLATSLKVLSEDLLKKILYLITPQIAVNQLEKVTGKTAHNDREYYLFFNHYRPEKNLIGMGPHKDSGFITLLSANKQGLIVKLKDIWGSILPKENHFIIHFNNALEMLINDTSKLTAVLHAVEQIKDHDGRISFGLSIEGAPDSSLYKLAENGSLEEIHTNYQTYLKEFFKKLYDAIN